jgi:nicotinate-nucleotide adenylyltransferase
MLRGRRREGRRTPERRAGWIGPGSYPLAWVSIPPVGIASSDLRRRLAEGRSIRYMVPRGVEAYIEAHGLYRDPARAHAPGLDLPSGESSPV